MTGSRKATFFSVMSSGLTKTAAGADGSGQPRNVAVVGAGLVGALEACFLAQRGMKVIVVILCSCINVCMHDVFTIVCN